MQLVSWESRHDLYSRLDQTKSFWFSGSIVALLADDPDIMLEICRDAYLALYAQNTAGPLTVRQTADKVAEMFGKQRNRATENKILKPLGLNYESFISQGNKLSPVLLQTVIRRILDEEEGRVPGVAIIAGLDDAGGHIYLIQDPGHAVTCDAEGFGAIGIGREHAESVFTEAAYTSGRQWTEAVLLTYIAKKRAEVAPGVGHDTDLYWIRADGYRYLEPKAPLLRQMDRVRVDRERRARFALDAGHRRVAPEIDAIPPAPEIPA